MKHASRRIRSLVILVALLAPGPVMGQNVQGLKPADAVSEDADSDTQQATVVIDGAPLFVIRGVAAYPAAGTWGFSALGLPRRGNLSSVHRIRVRRGGFRVPQVAD